jgi:type VI secretion system protein ImpH
MLASQRRPDIGVIDELFAHPHRFDFFQAVSLLGLWLRQRGVKQERIFDDCLRFGNRLSLSFPPSQLAELNVADAALSPHLPPHIRIVPAFFSLLGSTGVMPFHYTERIAAHERNARGVGDDGGGPRGFLDMLSTRSVSLFYRAWAQQRPEHMVTANGGDGFLAVLSALAGVAPRTDQGHMSACGAAVADELDDEVIARYAAQLRCRPVPACMVAGVLADYFNVPIVLRQLIACWETLPAQDQARLGRHHVALGAGVLPGTRIRQRNRRAELRIGPLYGAELQRFLAGQRATMALGKLLDLFCGTGIGFVVRLVLRAEDVVACRLPGGGGGGGPRLGVDAFLPEGAARRDRDDLAYLLDR